MIIIILFELFENKKFNNQKKIIYYLFIKLTKNLFNFKYIFF